MQIVKYSLNQMKFKVLLIVEPQLRGGITLIVHFLGAKELNNSKGGELRSQYRKEKKLIHYYSLILYIHYTIISFKVFPMVADLPQVKSLKNTKKKGGDD